MTDSFDYDVGVLDDPERLMVTPEVAAISRFTEAYICRLAREKRIPHLRFGDKLRFRRQSILNWFAEIEANGGELPNPAA